MTNRGDSQQGKQTNKQLNTGKPSSKQLLMSLTSSILSNISCLLLRATCYAKHLTAPLLRESPQLWKLTEPTRFPALLCFHLRLCSIYHHLTYNAMMAAYNLSVSLHAVHCRDEEPQKDNFSITFPYRSPLCRNQPSVK